MSRKIINISLQLDSYRDIDLINFINNSDINISDIIKKKLKEELDKSNNKYQKENKKEIIYYDF